MSFAASGIRKVGKEIERGLGRVERESRRHGGRMMWPISPIVPLVRGAKTSLAKMSELPPLPTSTSTITVPGYAGQAEGQRRKRRKGYSSTILAGDILGVASTRKQILG